MKKKIVIKIGSSTLTRGTHQISRGKIEDIARQIIVLREEYDIVLVSSGAIATARQFMELTGNNPMVVKQALAAIGQPILIRIYQEVFGDFGLQVAQCLMHSQDFDRAQSRDNIQNTVDLLLENGYIPIINENDTVATEEIQFGDNDKLAALTACLLKADLLLLASDIDGLFSGDPKSSQEVKLIEKVVNIEEVEHLAGSSSSELGTGGMTSKLAAAKICRAGRVEMWIINGSIEGFAVKALNQEMVFTRFLLAT